jgi:ribosomal-protein-alanine N-acetyltransferase
MFSLIAMTVQDGGTLEQIHAACFSDAWDRDAFDHLLTENLTCGWIATLDGNPVGFVLARVLGDEAEILTFAVQPSAQRLGIGRCLLKELIDFLKSVECGKIFLEVAVDNEAAIALYTSAGFIRVGTRPNYYQRADQVFISASIMAWVKDEIGFASGLL